MVTFLPQGADFVFYASILLVCINGAAQIACVSLRGRPMYWDWFTKALFIAIALTFVTAIVAALIVLVALVTSEPGAARAGCALGLCALAFFLGFHALVWGFT
ncbi:MAG: hypothetical protein LC772_12275 [Chloroflexi bacterium]|nr:hypothetical protein [Chloroflexota bacterium]